MVKIGAKYGYIDKTGKEIITPKYDEVYQFQEGLGLVKSKSQGGLSIQPAAK